MIIKLSEDIINLIAAGEVVERPASIVKELTENAIDAGAKHIEASVRTQGDFEITIKDDGVGLSEEEIQMAVVRHTTSKIKKSDDLYNISSHGFRGEALSSIISVSEVSISSRKKSSEFGYECRYKEGNLISSNKVTMEPGTTITVSNIFSTIPARRKFLKTSSTEYRHVYQSFVHLALSTGSVGFAFIKDGHMILSLGKELDIKEKIQIITKLSEEDLVEISYDGELTINGYVEHPKSMQKNGKYKEVSVNGRYVESKVIHAAVKQAYSGFSFESLSPQYFVNIELHPHLVDVNVHPRKLEVAFQDKEKVYRAVYQSVRHALEKKLSTEQKEILRSVPMQIDSVGEGVSTRPSRQSVHTGRSDIFKLPAMPVTTKKHEQEKMQITTEKKLTQMFNTYIVFEEDDELVFVDQHAAAERISFEALSLDKDSQDLLVTEEIGLDEHDYTLLSDSIDELKKSGIEIELNGSNIVSVKAVPILFKGEDTVNLIRLILHAVESGAEVKDEITYDKNASEACHSSIRAGRRLEDIEMKQILKDLLKCNNPYSCPHGRPIVWRLSKSTIERGFKRIQ